MTGRAKLELIYERKISIRQLFLCSDKAWVHTSCFSVGDSRSVSIKLLAAFHQSHSIRCTRVVNPSKDLTVFQISGTCVYQLCFSLKSNACILYLTCYCYIYRTNKIISPEHLHKKFYFLNLCDTMQHINMYATKTVLCVSWTSSHSFALFFIYRYWMMVAASFWKLFVLVTLSCCGFIVVHMYMYITNVTAGSTQTGGRQPDIVWLAGRYLFMSGKSFGLS